MLTESIGLSDKADALIEVIAVANELLARGSESAVGSVPRERPVSNLGFDAELGVEERLPSISLAPAWWLIKEQEVAPVMRRVTGRADGQVPVPSFDATIGGQHVEARRPYERSRRRSALSVVAHGMKTRTSSQSCQERAFRVLARDRSHRRAVVVLCRIGLGAVHARRVQEVAAPGDAKSQSHVDGCS